jgi:hypothetical protein
MFFGYHRLWSPMPIVPTTLFMGSLFYMYIVRLSCFSSPFYIIVFVIYEKFTFFMVLKHSHWVAIEWRKGSLICLTTYFELLFDLLEFFCEFVIFIHTIVLKTSLFQQKGKIQNMDDTITIVKSPCTRQESVFIWKAT